MKLGEFALGKQSFAVKVIQNFLFHLARRQHP
jgi:hypothetical protein